MACPDSGQIKISDLVNEFGGSAPHAISEYYRNGANVPGNNTNVATSGQISLTQFYSSVNEIQQVYSSNATNLNLSSIFGSNWGSTVPKRVVINSGVTIGGTGSNYAINVPTGMAGTLVIDNAGSIEGHGGSANSGTGGNAVHCAQTSGVTINNTGAIKAGGGGGGQGGSGGTGGNGGTGGQGGQGRNSYQVGANMPTGVCGQQGSAGTYNWRMGECSRYRGATAYIGNTWGSGYGYNGECFHWTCMNYAYTTGAVSYTHLRAHQD